MHESDPYPYDDAYDPAAVRSQRMERRRREQRRRWRRCPRKHGILTAKCRLLGASPQTVSKLEIGRAQSRKSVKTKKKDGFPRLRFGNYE